MALICSNPLLKSGVVLKLSGKEFHSTGAALRNEFLPIHKNNLKVGLGYVLCQ